ncbi:Trans-enoyl reductase fsr4 [Paramyrothecium foliicola]|nr:Trans-enoyl reductase fsr4 [Paramyrothecium foliicola]
MKEAIVCIDTSVKIHEVPVPTPGPKDVLIKVIVAGTNPKDWKVPTFFKKEQNSGDDIAGVVESVGADVTGFNKGDRVAAFHIMLSPSGAFAEYAIAPAHTVFPLPSSLSFEEAATIPLAAYTAAVALFDRLGLPAPWDPRSRQNDAKKHHLLIYGASTAVGAYGIKLANASNIHPIIAVGSQNSEFIRPYLDESKGDRLLNYKEWASQDDMVNAVKSAGKEAGLEDGRFWNVFDGVSEEGTFDVLSKAIAGAPNGAGQKPKIAVVLPGHDYSAADSSVEISVVNVGHVHEEDEGKRLFGLIWGQAFIRGISEGWFKTHPYEIAEGGLEKGVEVALRGLREGTVRGKKMVIRVSEDK